MKFILHKNIIIFIVILGEIKSQLKYNTCIFSKNEATAFCICIGMSQIPTEWAILT